MAEQLTQERVASIKSEDHGEYAVVPTAPLDSEDRIIERAMEILSGRMQQPGAYLVTPGATARYLRLSLGGREHEVFCAVWLNTRHSVIGRPQELFRGTIDGASVYPREVVKAALACNAAAVVLAHNHPSGAAEPSMADKHITQRLKDALALVGVRVLDHLIVGDGEAYSFAEHGLI